MTDQNHEREMLQLIDQRDHSESKATELAEAVGQIIGVDVGEHSSANCPVQTAIDAVDEFDAFTSSDATEEGVETLWRVATGMSDSRGQEIFVGDRLMKPVDCNHEFHGQWAVYEVRQQGLTPLIAYLRSEKGALLPEGYLASPLCDEYDRKMFCYAKDPSKLIPMDDIRVMSADEYDALDTAS